MKRQERGGTKEAFINSNHNVKKLITLDTSIQNPFHLTPNELNDSELNLKIGTGNLQSLKGKDSKTDVFMATETWLRILIGMRFGYWNHKSTREILGLLHQTDLVPRKEEV